MGGKYHATICTFSSLKRPFGNTSGSSKAAAVVWTEGVLSAQDFVLMD